MQERKSNLKKDNQPYPETKNFQYSKTGHKIPLLFVVQMYSWEQRQAYSWKASYGHLTESKKKSSKLYANF